MSHTLCHWSQSLLLNRMVNMEKDGLKKLHWRKSGQWIALVRKHAELVVKDTLISRLFKE